MLAAHPELRSLFCPDPAFVPVATAVCLTHLAIAALLRDSAWGLVGALAWCSGAVSSSALLMGTHECCHGLAFGQRRPLANRAFALLLNLPLLLPSAATMRKYHLEHHRFLGQDRIDTDIPSELECRVFRGVLGKLVFQAFHMWIVSLRTLLCHPKRFADIEWLGVAVQIAFDAALYGLLGQKAVTYLFLSTFFAYGPHPAAGYQLTNHFHFFGEAQALEAVSYYGPFNAVLFNAAHHVEHHDLPYVPGSRLPLVRRLAPEFYAALPRHDSFLGAFWRFLTDPRMTLRCHQMCKVRPTTVEPEGLVTKDELRRTPIGRALDRLNFYALHSHLLAWLWKTFRLSLP